MAHVVTSALTTDLAAYAIRGVIDLVERLTGSPALKPDTAALHEMIANLDVDARMVCLHALVESIDVETCPGPVKTALECLVPAIRAVEDDLKIIQGAIEYHQSRYFSAWRACSYEEPLGMLEKHAAILIKRGDMLVEMLKIGFAKNEIDRVSVK